MLTLPIDEGALDNAPWSLCLKCGSTRLVSSVTIDDPVQNPGRDISGWVCKQCRNDMLRLPPKGIIMCFGDEGFQDDNLTFYDEAEIIEKVSEFNEQFEDKGCRARLLFDSSFYFHVEVTVDDGQPELADAVKEAENIEKLCRDKVLFSRRRR